MLGLILAVLLHLEADFRQTKEMQLMAEEQHSAGRLVYTAPDYLRWEYTSPQAMVWEVSNTKTNTPPQVQRLLRLIMSTISGDYLDAADGVFDIVQDGQKYTLTPRKRELRQLFSRIVLTLNPETGIAEQVILIESNGDKSTILFHPTKTEFQ